MAVVKRIQRPLSPKDQRRNAEQAERDVLRLTSAGNNNASTLTGAMIVDNGNIDIVNEGSVNAIGQALDYTNSLLKVTTSLANRLRWNVNVGAWILTAAIWFGRSDKADSGDSPRVGSDYGDDVTATSAIIPTEDWMPYYGSTIVQKSNFAANQWGSSLGASAFDASVNLNGTGQSGSKASAGISATPGYVNTAATDDVGQNFFNGYTRANVPAVDYWSQNYLSYEWQINGQPNVSIKVTPARRFTVTAVGVDLNSPVNITGLLTAQAITATDLTASGTVQGTTVKATGQVQGASAVFTGNVQVGSINGAAYPPVPTSPVNITAATNWEGQNTDLANYQVGNWVVYFGGKFHYTGANTTAGPTSGAALTMGNIPSPIRPSSEKNFVVMGIWGATGVNTPVRVAVGTDGTIKLFSIGVNGTNTNFSVTTSTYIYLSQIIYPLG